MPESVFNPADFPRSYRWEFVKAYPVISGVPDIYEATDGEIDAGFERILAAKNLRLTHQMYLDDRSVWTDA